MRKTLLSIFVSLPVFVFSQSLSLSNARIDKEDGNTLHKARITVTNNSSSDIEVFVKREIISLQEGHITYFCWGQCYSPNTNISPTGRIVPAGSYDSEAFYGDLDDYDVPGTSIVKYTFYDKKDPENKVEHTFYYGTTSVVANVNQDFTGALSSPFPNPARNFSKINYDLTNHNYSSASVHVRNLTGSLVKKIKLENGKGEVVLGTENLPDGIYTYSLIVDEKSVLTKKLIVAN